MTAVARLTLPLALASAALLVGVGLAGAREGTADATTLVVPAKADLFASGLTAVPQLPGGGGVLPPSLGFTAAPGDVVTVDAATGSTVAGSGFGTTGPAGYADQTTDVQSLGHISGYAGKRGLFLAGVFLGDGPPAGPAPARLGNGPGDAVTPKLGQVFAIGLGR